jgi:hypothetical protein
MRGTGKLTLDRSFRFTDDRLNRQAIRLIRKARVPCAIDSDRVIHYSEANQERIENDLLGLVRAEAFPRWIILSCPADWTEKYRTYMKQHGVHYYEELKDGRLYFLLSARHRPHQWKIPS